MTLTFLTLAALITATISGFIGMAGGVTLLAAMTFFLPANALIPIHGIVQLGSNSTRSLFLFKHVSKPIFLWFCSGLPLGTIASYYFLSYFSYRPQWFLLFIAALLLYTALKPKKVPGLELNSFGFFLLGSAAAALGPLIGATGPLLAPFLVRKDLEKEKLVATKAACQTMTHLLKIPIFLSLSFPYKEHFVTIVLMLVAVVAGTKIGTTILKTPQGNNS